MISFESNLNSYTPLDRLSQTGFYVVVSDRDLLSKMQHLMKRQGYFGYVDTAGKLMYMIDGRQNMYKAAHTIRQLMPQVKEETSSYDKGNHNSQKSLTKKMTLQILSEYGYSKQHKGTSVLQYLLPIACENEEKISPLSKFLYPQAATKFGVRLQQVDRLIRYASQSSSLSLPNRVLIKQLVDEINSKVLEAKLSGTKKGAYRD